MCAADTLSALDFSDWPADIWSRILTMLEPSGVSTWPSSYYLAKLQASQQITDHQEYCSLRLVCRKLNEIVCGNTQLMMRLVHCQDDSSMFLNKLLTYGKADRRLQALTCFSETICTGMLLPQLLVSPTELTHISISAVSTATLSCLYAFPGLVSCQLYQPSEDLVNLQSLAALPKLENLTLQGGCFHCLLLGYHLTGLQIDKASVSCVPGSTDLPGLQSLSIGSSARIVLPGVGLGECLS